MEVSAHPAGVWTRSPKTATESHQTPWIHCKCNAVSVQAVASGYSAKAALRCIGCSHTCSFRNIFSPKALRLPK